MNLISRKVFFKRKAVKMGVLDLLTVLRWSPLLASNKRRGGEPRCHTALRYFLLSLHTVYISEHSSDSYNEDKLL